MTSSLLLLVLSFACSPSTTVIGGEEEGDPADTGSNGNGDGDTDIGGETGAETGGDTEEEIEDPTPGDYAGDYQGQNRGTLSGDDRSVDCRGDVEFTVDDDGLLEGYASCEFDGGGGDSNQEGDVLGEVDAEGVVTLIWTVGSRRESADIEGEGQITDGVAFVELFAEFDGYADYVGEMDAELR